MTQLSTKTKEVKVGTTRPPVVAILGHIDHGKSTLIDYIRKSNVTAGEAGGITQHPSAYEITHRTKEGESIRITLLDTPGHEAFSSIRTRCANVADIAALIVSAEDGVKPQTLEVLKHITECGLPLVVVITKIDKPTADIERTKSGLAEHGILVEGYGGSTPVVEVSGVKGTGVDDFLDMVTLLAALDEKTGDTESLGSGTIIETRHDSKRGIVSVGIIKDGTVRTGLVAATSGATSPIRFMLDAESNMVEELTFSSPVQIVGWDQMPEIGSEFRTFLKKDEAIAYSKTQGAQVKSQSGDMNDNITSLPILLKTDTAGSLEAIKAEILKLSKERIVPKIIFSGIGVINENDIKNVITIPGINIIGFNVKTDIQAKALAERSGITILNFNIIYELTDTVKKVLEDKEPRVQVEEILSSTKVLKIFSTAKGKQVLGGKVLTGTLKKGSVVKINRRDTFIGTGKVKELQQSKIAAESINEGLEFGAMIESKFEIAPGDILESVEVVTK